MTRASLLTFDNTQRHDSATLLSCFFARQMPYMHHVRIPSHAMLNGLPQISQPHLPVLCALDSRWVHPGATVLLQPRGKKLMTCARSETRATGPSGYHLRQTPALGHVDLLGVLEPRKVTRCFGLPRFDQEERNLQTPPRAVVVRVPPPIWYLHKVHFPFHYFSRNCFEIRSSRNVIRQSNKERGMIGGLCPAHVVLPLGGGEAARLGGRS